MVWTAPTVSVFRARFPEFVAVSDGQIQTILTESIADIPDTWRDSDRTSATLYLTAHLLASFGIDGSNTGDGTAFVGALKSRKVGDVSVEFAGSNSGNLSGMNAQYATTAYGNRYLSFVKRNTPLIAWV